MGYLNTMYRAFLEYRKHTNSSPELKGSRRNYKNSDKELDKFETIKLDVTIDEEWVIEIEKGLEFVTKAVLEERQFIETTGEVVPIEKVRRVSKASVSHLAKHSNLITKLPEDGKDIIPEKIYMVEKLSDYTVYENRFLYMLLCYLRDFIDLRLSKIEEAISAYNSDFYMSKTFSNKVHDFVFETSYKEKRKDNQYPIINDKTKRIVERIKACAHDVQSLLATELMTQVADAPMIKPPITKTNVLKMNNNFKNAVALYEFVASYNSLGYEINEVKEEYHPFVDPFADEIAELISLTSFLTYEYGNNLLETLKIEYENEELQKKQEEEQKIINQLKELKRRINESGQGMEEYILLIEKRNHMLEKDSEDLVQVRKDNEGLKREILELTNENGQLSDKIDYLSREISRLEEEIVLMKIKHQNELEQKEREYIDLLTKKQEEHDEEIDKLTEEFDNEKELMISQFESEKDKMVVSFEKEKKYLFDDYNNHLDDLTRKIEEVQDQNDALANSLKDKDAEIISKSQALELEKQNIINECNKTIEDNLISTGKEIGTYKTLAEIANEEKAAALAQVLAIKKLTGLIDKEIDYTTKEMIEQLEVQKNAFNKFFKEEWKKAKKKIREEILGSKNKTNKPNETIENIDSVNNEITEIESSDQNELIKDNNIEEAKASDDSLSNDNDLNKEN